MLYSKHLKISLSFLIIASGFLLETTNVHAAAYKEPSAIHPSTAQVSASEKAIELPGGGFLFGSGTFDGRDASGKRFTLDPATTKYKVTTVGQAREDDKKVSSSQTTAQNNLFGTSRIAVSSGGVLSRTTTSNYFYGLKDGQGYSEEMGGTGWRFAKYVFYSNSNSGPYLLWTASRDTGIVGNVPEANQTWIYNSPKGIRLSAGSSQYFNSGYDYNSMKTFYSYNPAASSYYEVVNR